MKSVFGGSAREGAEGGTDACVCECMCDACMCGPSEQDLASLKEQASNQGKTTAQVSGDQTGGCGCGCICIPARVSANRYSSTSSSALDGSGG